MFLEPPFWHGACRREDSNGTEVDPTFDVPSDAEVAMFPRTGSSIAIRRRHGCYFSRVRRPSLILPCIKMWNARFPGAASQGPQPQKQTPDPGEQLVRRGCLRPNATCNSPRWRV